MNSHFTFQPDLPPCLAHLSFVFVDRLCNKEFIWLLLASFRLVVVLTYYGEATFNSFFFIYLAEGLAYTSQDGYLLH